MYGTSRWAGFWFWLTGWRSRRRMRRFLREMPEGAILSVDVSVKPTVVIASVIRDGCVHVVGELIL